MGLREDPEDFDTVAEGVQALRGRGVVKSAGCVGVEPAHLDWIFFILQAVPIGGLTVDFLLDKDEFEGLTAEEVDPDETIPGFVFDLVFGIGEDHGTKDVDGLVVGSDREEGCFDSKAELDDGAVMRPRSST